jgi:pSer/pThr/pTyr-binding forkhead associated (FHA) protein
MKLRMKVVKGKPQGHCLTFPNGEFMFGRGPECDIRPNSDLVSRQHCILQITDETALIRDLGSRNGTLVNGQIVLGEFRLSHGDTLQLGPLVLEVIFDTETGTSEKPTHDTAVMSQDETTLQPPSETWDRHL